ncbi:MAG: TadE family protein, partial [Dorea sp.]
MNKEKTFIGSMTIEMSFIMPMILGILMLSIWSGFYYHDKNILAGAAYETAVVGSTKMRQKEAPDVSELTTMCQERIGRKCIFFGKVTPKVLIDDEEICVQVTARKGKFRLKIEKRAV